MRRTDREVTDTAALLAIMAQCDVCRLALHDADYPYILPLNFGVKYFGSADGGKVVLYFHGAKQGYKYELIARDPRASFEMDCCHELDSDEERGYCTMNYMSVIGRGRLEIVEDEAEKLEALTILTDHYHEQHFAFNPAAIPRTTVMRLEVESMSGKHKQMPGKAKAEA